MTLRSPHMIMPADLRQGDKICIYLGGRPSHASPRFVHVLGVVINATPKAGRVRLGGARHVAAALAAATWLAHPVRGQWGITAGMARWWKPADNQQAVIEACRTVA